MHGMKGADKHYGEREYGSDKQAQSQAQGQAQTHTQANPQIQEEPGSGAGAATQTQAQAQTQTQAQTQARPSQRAPIAAGSLKWQSCIRSLIGKWQILKGRQNWIFKVWVPAAALETPRGGQSRL